MAKGTVLDALGDAAVEAAQVALDSAKSGRYTEANELLGFVDRLTYAIIAIEDHNKSENRSGTNIVMEIDGKDLAKCVMKVPDEEA